MRKITLVLCVFIYNISFSQVTYYGGVNGEKFDHFLYYLDNYYVENTDNTNLTDIAIRTALSTLDPFSVYHSAEESLNQLNADKGFNPKGTGFGIYFFNGKILVNYLTPNSPADKLRIEVHDELLKINNIDLSILKQDSINNILNSAVDTLSLSLKKHSGEIKELELIKTLLPYSSLVSSYMLNETVGYIKMIRFTLTTEDEFITAINTLKSNGLTSLILDLRGNPGGAKIKSIELVDHFLKDKKLIAYSMGAHYPKEESYSKKKGVFEQGKLIVLTDNITASASELFSVAIQDHDRGIIMGQETYGKGLIQQSYKLKDGSTVRLTIGKNFSPSGRLIQKSEYKDWTSSVAQKFPNNGETAQGVFHDSLFTKTISGRTVLVGEGGIVPDIYLKKDNLSTLNNWSYFQQGYAYDFALSYSYVQRSILFHRYKNVESLMQDNSLNDQLVLEFKNYLIQKGFDTTVTESIHIPKPALFRIKAWISSLLWNDDAYHRVNNKNDRLIEQAVDVLANEKRYNKILSSKN